MFPILIRKTGSPNRLQSIRVTGKSLFVHGFPIVEIYSRIPELMRRESYWFGGRQCTNRYPRPNKRNCKSFSASYLLKLEVQNLHLEECASTVGNDFDWFVRSIFNH